jgi:hypothetical protein
MRSPEMARLAGENPKAFQSAVISLMDRLETNGNLPSVAGPDELDQDSSHSSNYREPKETPQPSPTPRPEPKRGPEKWASDGADAVAAIEPSLNRETLLANPRARNLLITASGMKPGSKAMNDVIARLKRYGGAYE